MLPSLWKLGFFSIVFSFMTDIFRFRMSVLYLLIVEKEKTSSSSSSSKNSKVRILLGSKLFSTTCYPSQNISFI